MSLLRVIYLLAGLLAAAAFLLGVVCDWGKLSAAFATLHPAEVLLVALGPVLAVLTGAAGVLIAADVRADMAAAEAWHEIHAEAVVIATPAETASIDRVDALYVAGPQDEGLRRILLAHRCMVPVSLNGIESLAPERGGASADTQPTGAAVKPVIQAAGIIAAADDLGDLPTAHAATQRKLGPHLISSNPVSARRRDQHYTFRMAFAPKRVANAGPRWIWPAFATAATMRVPGSDFACNEIILADRSGRDENSAPSDVAPEAETTVQPCCRGPPRATFRRQVADGPAHLGKPFRETALSRAKPPADLVVIDNLGDRVPVCEPELEVLEAYLEDVLREVLGSADTVTKPT